MRACKNGHKGVIQLLLEHSDIDVLGYEGLSLMTDFIELHLEAFKALKRFNEIHRRKRRKFCENDE